MRSAWPQYDKALHFPEEEQRIAWAKEVVRAVRTLRVDMNVPAAKKVHMTLVSEDEAVRGALAKSRAFLCALAGAESVSIKADKAGIPDDAVSAVTAACSVWIPLNELVDIAKEIERLEGEVKRLDGELARSDGMLKNEKFISRAPQAKIDAEKEKREKYAKMREEVLTRLSQLR